MDSWCWLWSRCPLWKIYSETQYRLCEWRMRNEINGRWMFFPGGFTSPPTAQGTHEAGGCPSPSDFTSVWRHQTYTLHASPRTRPSSAQAPPPLPYSASWVDDCLLKPHPPHTRTNIIQIIIYYAFNLLLWMNQGLRLALCSVQYWLSEGTKKSANSRTCRRENKSYLYFPAWTSFSHLVSLKVSVFTSRYKILFSFPSQQF